MTVVRKTGRKSRGRQKPAGGAAPPPEGGRFLPLAEAEAAAICDSAFSILETIGLADTPDMLRGLALRAGAKLRPDGRLTFPRSLVEDGIAQACKRVELPGFDPGRGIEIGGGRVHIGTGGAAVSMLEGAAGTYRESKLQDLYELLRVVDACPHIAYGLRPVVARDLPDPWTLDANTAFAVMSATTKPVGTSFFEAAHVPPIVEMFDTALGGEGRFRAQPFCFAAICHVVPPLRFAAEACEVMAACVRLGVPVQICSAGQAGATSPASLAGALAQGLAESLAGLVMVNLLSPGFPCILAFMPFIADLRTGAMSGGSGEAAVASAAAAQLLLRLGLPSTVSAGITDAKVADSQAGYEKGYTVALAAQAGADMINLSVGMLGSIMVASPEALVIDDDMCGAILRSVKGIDAGDAALNLEMMEAVVTGAGHYLGEAQTLSLMKTEYLYPSLGDRQSVDDWLESGAESLWARAEKRVAEILAADPPSHVPKDAEEKIRSALPIRLERQR